MPYKDKEKMREYQNRWIQQRRAEYFNGKTCVKCGSTESLELDHIDPETKRYNPGMIWGMSDSNPNKIEELAKCQILCEECHKDKTSTYFRNTGMSITKRCPHDHDLSLVGSVKHADTRMGVKVVCGYCKYLANHRRADRKKKPMTLDEYIKNREKRLSKQASDA